MDDLKISDLGEQGLLQRLQQFCPADLIGDDAALLSIAPDHSLVVTTDTLVDGTHFSLGHALPHLQTMTAKDAGWRSAAANLSDLAAMAATPLGITVSLSLPNDVPVAWIEELYQGIVACLQPFHTPIVGGDVCRSPILAITITALGQVLPERAFRRSAAQPGDVIVVTGEHGAARAGLELLLHPDRGQALAAIDRAALILAHQRPRPRLDVIQHGVSLWADSANRAIAGIDSSDGLADAVLQICRASRVGAILDRTQIPVPAVLTTWVTPAQALEWALYGGEDFELVLCLPRSMAQSLIAQLGAGAAIVGEVTAEPMVMLQGGNCPEEQLSLERGFQHWRES